LKGGAGEGVWFFIAGEVEVGVGVKVEVEVEVEVTPIINH